MMKIGKLTGKDVRDIRVGLLLTQRELASLLGYSHKIRISEYERAKNPMPIPLHIQLALLDLHEKGKTSPAVRERRRAA